MTQIQTLKNNIVTNQGTQRLLFKVFMSSFVCLSVVYAYLIVSITFNVLARKSLEVASSNINSRISELELTYLDNVNKIDKNYALTLGFVEVHNNLFATRTPSRVAMR